MSKQEFYDEMNRNIVKLGGLPIRADQTATIGIPVCEVINSLGNLIRQVVNEPEPEQPLEEAKEATTEE